MADHNTDIYTEIKERVDFRFQVRTQYFGHLIAFVILNLGMWTLVFTQDLSRQFFGFITVAWLAGVGIHTVNTLMYELRDRSLQRELERAGYYDQDRIKAKRDERLVRLGEDGELDAFYPEDEDSIAQTNYGR